MHDKPISFYNYITEHSTMVPIIQRDFAQGRNSEKEKQILNRFLKAIRNSLNKKNVLSLNFIYGTENQELDFLPIDGQQRLTTLFLFHWFTALKIKKLEEFLEKAKKFTYQTRASSVDFFDAIQSTNPKNCHIADFYSMRNASEMFNYNWFNTEWINDSTISSAIEVLNQMYSLYTDENFENWWTLLTGDECPIVFLYIPINKTDGKNKILDSAMESKAASTYIKMNARGKHLTDFENIKALIHSLSDSGKIFANNYDTNYINIIEKLADSKEKTLNLTELCAEMDKMMMQLLINIYNDLYLLTEKNIESNVTRSNYYKFSDAIRENIEKEKPSFTAFESEYYSIIDKIFNTNWDDDCKELFIDYCKKDDRPARLKFLSLYYFVFKLGFDINAVKEWRYIFYNFHILDPRNTTAEKFNGTVYTLSMLINAIKSKPVKSPFKFLKETPLFPAIENIPSVSSSDWKEEHIKSSIITTKSLPHDYFIEIEDKFDKRIRLFLYMAGFWEKTGDKAKLDKYINLAKTLDLHINKEPPLVLVKLFYLFATGFSGSSLIPVSEIPSFDKTLYAWDKDTEINTLKIKTLAAAFDYLLEKEIYSCADLNKALNIIADELYKKKDWRAYSLKRNEQKLFQHIDKDDIDSFILNNNRKINIFSLVMKLDLMGNNFSNIINYEKNHYFGEIGQNNRSLRRITLEKNLSGSLDFEIPQIEEYTFYTEHENLFKIYRYKSFDGISHVFDTCSFDITSIVSQYNELTEKIKIKLKEMKAENLNKILTKVIYHEPDEMKNICKTIAPELYKVDHYRNTVIIHFIKKIAAKDDEHIKKTIEKLSLEKE